MQKSHMLIGHEGVVRALTIRHSTLYSGGSDTKLKVSASVIEPGVRLVNIAICVLSMCLCT